MVADQEQRYCEELNRKNKEDMETTKFVEKCMEINLHIDSAAEIIEPFKMEKLHMLRCCVGAFPRYDYHRMLVEQLFTKLGFPCHVIPEENPVLYVISEDISMDIDFVCDRSLQVENLPLEYLGDIFKHPHVPSEIMVNLLASDRSKTLESSIDKVTNFIPSAVKITVLPEGEDNSEYEDEAELVKVIRRDKRRLKRVIESALDNLLWTLLKSFSEEEVVRLCTMIQKYSLFAPKRRHPKMSEVHKIMKEKNFLQGILFYEFSTSKMKIAVKNEEWKLKVQNMFGERYMDKEVCITCSNYEHTKVDFLMQSKRFCCQNVGVCDMKNFGGHKYGTIGAVVKINDDNKKMVAMTCKHVCNLNDKVYIKHDGEVKMFGRCERSLDNNTLLHDFSLISVDPIMTRTIIEKDEAYFIDIDNKCYPSKLTEKEDYDEFLDEVVYKKGAATDFTTGQIFAYRFYNYEDTSPCIVVVPFGSNEDFAKPGDSGSLVYRYEFEDGPTYCEVIAMVKGGYCDTRHFEREERQVDCIPMKQCIDELKSKYKDIHSLDFFAPPDSNR